MKPWGLVASEFSWDWDYLSYSLLKLCLLTLIISRGRREGEDGEAPQLILFLLYVLRLEIFALCNGKIEGNISRKRRTHNSVNFIVKFTVLCCNFIQRHLRVIASDYVIRSSVVQRRNRRGYAKNAKRTTAMQTCREVHGFALQFDLMSFMSDYIRLYYSFKRYLTAKSKGIFHENVERTTM